MSRAIIGFLKKRMLRVVAGALFTAIIIAVMAQTVTAAAIGALIESIHLPTALSAVIAYAGLTALRGWRYLTAGANITFRQAFQIAAVHSALLRVMPLRSGELAYGLLVKQVGGGEFIQGMASIVLLRILDLAVILPLAAVVIAVTLSGTVSELGIVAIGVVGCLFGILAFAIKPLLKGLRRRVVARSGGSLASKGLGLLDAILVAFEIPRRRYLQLVLITLLIWAGLIICFHLSFLAIGAVDTFGQGLVGAVLGIVGSILPLSLLGSFGPMEGGLAMGLSLIGQERGIAFSNALVTSTWMLIAAFIVAVPAWISLMVDLRTTAGSRVYARVGGVLGPLFFSVAGGALLLFKIPYGFETNDQFQYFLLPYRQIFDPFLTGDWFTWETSHYHLTFSWLIRLLHYLVGPAHFSTAVFALHAAVLMGLSYAIWRLTKAMGFHAGAALFSILALAFVRRMGLAETTVNHGVLLPADMALPLFLLALAHWIDKNPLRTGIFLGLAGLIHANYAVLGPLTIAGPEVYRLVRERAWRPTLEMAGAFVALSLPTLVVTVSAFLTTDAAPEAMSVLFLIRSPHHYAPALVNSPDVVFMISVVLLSLPLFAARCRNGRRHLAVFLALIGAQLLAAMATILEQPALVRLFFWRLSLALMVLSTIGVGQVLMDAIIRRDVGRLLYAVSAVTIVAGFSAGGVVKWHPEVVLKGHGFLVAAIPVLLAAWIFERFAARPWRHVRYLFAGAPMVVLLYGSALAERGGGALEWQKALKQWQRFHAIDAALVAGRRSALPVFEWIAEHTPRDALFLIPPGTDGFRFSARRAVFVDWKCCPMKGEEIAEWRRRMLAVMGTSRFPATGYALHRAANRRYHGRKLADLASLARREAVTHILAKARPEDDAAAGVKRVYSRGGWAVYEVTPPPRR